MHRVENINLGGIPFVINEDAYKMLEAYLKAVRAHFTESSMQDEIMQDIEIRMAEIFTEQLSGRHIVDMKILDEAINRLGRPEQFAPESEEPLYRKRKTSAQYDEFQEEKETAYTVGKKLFRSPDDNIIAGVCGGFAAYFGMTEPIWIRILFVIFLISGFGLVLYIILWAIIPKAKTAADKLAMKGKPVTFSSIGHIVEEEISDIGKKFEKWAK